MVDTTEVMVEDTVAVEEVVETEGEEAMAE
jgi:hypothetical protein